MIDLTGMLGVFIAWPWLALVPAGLFLVLHRISRHRLAAAVGLAWLVYAVYEYSMQRRWLCSGECNIRVDLLLVYPVLAVASLAAVVAGLRAVSGGRSAQPRRQP